MPQEAQLISLYGNGKRCDKRAGEKVSKWEKLSLRKGNGKENSLKHMEDSEVKNKIFRLEGKMRKREYPIDILIYFLWKMDYNFLLKK